MRPVHGGDVETALIAGRYAKLFDQASNGSRGGSGPASPLVDYSFRPLTQTPPHSPIAVAGGLLSRCAFRTRVCCWMLFDTLSHPQLHETTPRAHRELGTARRGGARTTRKLTEAQQSARSCLTAAALPNSRYDKLCCVVNTGRSCSCCPSSSQAAFSMY